MFVDPSVGGRFRVLMCQLFSQVSWFLTVHATVPSLIKTRPLITIYGTLLLNFAPDHEITADFIDQRTLTRSLVFASPAHT